MLRNFFYVVNWRGMFREIFVMVTIIVVVNFALPRSIVQGSSMEPNLHTGERLAASPIPYWFGEPQHGDIVMLHPVEEDGPSLVKRIIGLPNETVEFRDKQLYIDGVLQDEPYVAEACRFKCADEIWELSENEYFIMGDNRNTSYDSRNYGAVMSDKIMARVFMRWWPVNDWAWFGAE